MNSLLLRYIESDQSAQNPEIAAAMSAIEKEIEDFRLELGGVMLNSIRKAASHTLNRYADAGVIPRPTKQPLESSPASTSGPSPVAKKGIGGWLSNLWPKSESNMTLSQYTNTLKEVEKLVDVIISEVDVRTIDDSEKAADLLRPLFDKFKTRLTQTIMASIAKITSPSVKNQAEEKPQVSNRVPTEIYEKSSQWWKDYESKTPGFNSGAKRSITELLDPDTRKIDDSDEKNRREAIQFMKINNLNPKDIKDVQKVWPNHINAPFGLYGDVDPDIDTTHGKKEIGEPAGVPNPHPFRSKRIKSEIPKVESIKKHNKLITTAKDSKSAIQKGGKLLAGAGRTRPDDVAKNNPEKDRRKWKLKIIRGDFD